MFSMTDTHDSIADPTRIVPPIVMAHPAVVDTIVFTLRGTWNGKDSILLQHLCQGMPPVSQCRGHCTGMLSCSHVTPSDTSRFHLRVPNFNEFNSTQLKKSLLVIGTKIHTLRNGESETKQGFIWLYTSNTSIDIWPLLLKEHNNG